STKNYAFTKINTLSLHDALPICLHQIQLAFQRQFLSHPYVLTRFRILLSNLIVVIFVVVVRNSVPIQDGQPESHAQFFTIVNASFMISPITSYTFSLIPIPPG